MLLANRYDKRTHFIFELLQNAEDALRRRNGWKGSRAVSFHLASDELRVSHYGHPFDEPDVRGVCGIAKSTKGIQAIGRFGIASSRFTRSPTGRKSTQARKPSRSRAMCGLSRLPLASASPMRRSSRSEGRFAPWFDIVSNALKTEPLLPCVGQTYASAANARLPGTQDLRDLFQPKQLAALDGTTEPLAWLSEGITADRTPELRQYLLHELDVAELTPDFAVAALDGPFPGKPAGRMDRALQLPFEGSGRRPTARTGAAGEGRNAIAWLAAQLVSRDQDFSSRSPSWRS